MDFIYSSGLGSLITLFAFCFFSCTKKKEVRYSEDEDINRWVKENLKDIRRYTRKDLTTLSLPKYYAAHKALTTRKRYSLWVEKLYLVKASLFDLEEQSHVQSLIDYPLLERARYDDGINEWNTFVDNWKREGREKV